MQEKILNTIIEKINQNVTLDTKIIDLGIDSLDLMTYIFEIEETFSVEIDQDSLVNLNTIGDLVNAIEAKL